MRKHKKDFGFVFKLAAAILLLSHQTTEAAGPGSMARGAAPRALFLNEGGPTLAPFAHVKFCMSMPDQCKATSGESMVNWTPEARKQLSMINSRINRDIRPLADPPGKEEWIIGGLTGSCHDYAVTKREALIRAGYSTNAVRLAVAFTGDGEGHAVVVVRTTNGDMVLDNRTNNIRRWDQTDLRWLKIESVRNPRMWVAL